MKNEREQAISARVTDVAADNNINGVFLYCQGQLMLDGYFTAAQLRLLADAMEGKEPARDLIVALYEELDEEFGIGIINGNWPSIKPLWDRCRAYLGIEEKT